MTIVQLRQPKKVVMTFYFYSAEFFMYIVKDIKCMCLPLKFAKEMCRKCIPFVQCLFLYTAHTCMYIVHVAVYSCMHVYCLGYIACTR